MTTALVLVAAAFGGPYGPANLFALIACVMLCLAHIVVMLVVARNAAD